MQTIISLGSEKKQGKELGTVKRRKKRESSFLPFS